jgi:predicted component of type VI protein secretion system
VHREVEARIYAFEPRAIERTVTAVERCASAGGTSVRLVIRALLEEQKLDAPVGRGF